MTNLQKKYCGQCGAPNPKTHNFCSSCGVKFEGIKTDGANLATEKENKSTAALGQATITGAAAGYMGARLAQTAGRLSSKDEINQVTEFSTTPMPSTSGGDGNEVLDALIIDNDGGDTVHAIVLDTNNDGNIDTVFIDNDGDGVADAIILDIDHDGSVDAVFLDNDGDGIIDKVILDSDFDGKPDISLEINEEPLNPSADWEDFFDF